VCIDTFENIIHSIRFRNDKSNENIVDLKFNKEKIIKALSLALLTSIMRFMGVAFGQNSRNGIGYPRENVFAQTER